MMVFFTKQDVYSESPWIAGSKALSFGEGLGEVFSLIFTLCSLIKF